MVADDPLVYGLLHEHTDLPQRTLPERPGPVELHVLYTTVPSPSYLTLPVEIVSNQLLELLPLLLRLIKQLLILVLPLPLLELQQVLLPVLNHVDPGNVSHLALLELILLVLRGLQILDDGIPKLDVDLEVERLFQPRLNQLLVRSHLVFLDTLDHPR
jgi:hypothetical protein